MGEAPEDLYRIVFESAPDGVLVVDEEGRIVRGNQRVCELFRCDPGQIVGQSVESLVPDSARERHRDLREAYGRRPVPRAMGSGLELRARRLDGSTFPVEISLSPLTRKEGAWVIAMIRDVSERKRLRDFGAGALRAAEEERQRIARELHDETAQHIAALLIRLSLWERAGAEQSWEDHIGELRSELKSCADTVRRIARNLRPPELEDAGLEAAIRSHLRWVDETFGVRVLFRGGGIDPLLDDDSRLIVYRIVQEAISNVVKHAEADHVRIGMGPVDGGVYVEIEDDGVGFDPHAASSSDARGNLGLIGMRERATMAGGAIVFESRPGRGTRVRVRLPGRGEGAVLTARGQNE